MGWGVPWAAPALTRGPPVVAPGGQLWGTVGGPAQGGGPVHSGCTGPQWGSWSACPGASRGEAVGGRAGQLPLSHPTPPCTTLQGPVGGPAAGAGHSGPPRWPVSWRGSRQSGWPSGGGRTRLSGPQILLRLVGSRRLAEAAPTAPTPLGSLGTALAWPDPAPRRDLVYSGFLTHSHHGLVSCCQKAPGIWQPHKVSSCCAEGLPVLPPLRPPRRPPALPRPRPSAAGSAESRQQLRSTAQVLFWQLLVRLGLPRGALCWRVWG